MRHFVAVAFLTFQVLDVVRVQKLVAPTLRHRNAVEQGVEFVKALDAHRAKVHAFRFDYRKPPLKFRRVRIFEVAAGIVDLEAATDDRGVAILRIVQVNVVGGNRSNAFYAC